MLQILPDAMSNELVSTVTASAMSVAVIQWMKNTKLVPFMDQHSSGLNRFIGWLAALLSATGIHYTFNHDTGTLTLTGLTVMGLTHTAWDTTKSYAFQWLVYRGVVKGPAADVAAVAGGTKAQVVVGPGAKVAGVEAAAEAKG